MCTIDQMKKHQDRVMQERERQLVQKENDKLHKEKLKQKEKGRVQFINNIYLCIFNNPFNILFSAQ